MANQLQLIISDRELAESTAAGYTRKPLIQFNVLVDQIKVTFDDEWANLDKVATFETDRVRIVAPYQDLMYIPWENMCDYGRLYVTLTGYDNDVAVINTQRMAIPLMIEESAPNEGTKPQEPTRSILIRALVASHYIEGMTATVTTLEAGSNPTVTIDKTNPNGYIVEFGIPRGSGVITEHDKLTNRDMDDSHPMSAITGLVAALAEKLGINHATDASAHLSLFNAKQDVIDDIATIRSGAAAGATAAQPSDVASAVSTHNVATSAHGDIRESISVHANNKNNPHEVTAAQVGADASGTAAGVVSAHNVSADAHSDIRESISTHSANKSNPHEVTYSQTGAEQAGVAQTLITGHNASNSAHSDIRSSIDTVNSKIMNGTTSSNQLTHTEFVNSSIATNTANFKGTYDVVTDLGLTDAATNAEIAAKLLVVMPSVTNNDYCFVYVRETVAKTNTQNTVYKRFKYSSASSSWGFEYKLNNTGFTAAQFAAIDSGITADKRAAYDTHVASTSNPHATTASQVGADPTGTAAGVVSTHNVANDAHSDIRQSITSHTGNTNNPHSVTAAQVGADASGTAASAVSTHNAASDAHNALFSTKQDKLISGTNLKTVNSKSLLGQGNIDVEVYSFEIDSSGNLYVLATEDTMATHQFTIEDGQLVITYNL